MFFCRFDGRASTFDTGELESSIDTAEEMFWMLYWPTTGTSIDSDFSSTAKVVRLLDIVVVGVRRRREYDTIDVDFCHNLIIRIYGSISW